MKRFVFVLIGIMMTGGIAAGEGSASVSVGNIGIGSSNEPFPDIEGRPLTDKEQQQTDGGFFKGLVGFFVSGGLEIADQLIEKGTVSNWGKVGIEAVIGAISAEIGGTTYKMSEVGVGLYRRTEELIPIFRSAAASAFTWGAGRVRRIMWGND
jgi:hypothetical protein